MFGVRIVPIKNCVKMWIVLNVLKNHLHLMKNQNIGVTKIMFHREMCLNVQAKNIILIAIIAVIQISK